MELVQIPAAQRQQISLYDDSLSGWVLDDSLPMEMADAGSSPSRRSRL